MIRAGVMMANFPWNMTNASSGICVVTAPVVSPLVINRPKSCELNECRKSRPLSQPRKLHGVFPPPMEMSECPLKAMQ
jgi:hypothetical protein